MTIIKTTDNTIYYTIESKTFKLEVTRNMILAIDNMFIGGGIIAATKAQKKAVLEFFHRTQATLTTKEHMQADIVELDNRRKRTSKMVEEKGYAFV